MMGRIILEFQLPGMGGYLNQEGNTPFLELTS